MYRRCLFCHSRFANNAMLPHLPIGRRIAFDPNRGRLWVVCRRCDGWNLTPFDGRLETIAQCEARWKETRQIDTTPGITLFRGERGVELVRVGNDDRAEFASWRLGRRFVRRRWMRFAQMTSILALAGFVVGGAIHTLGAMLGIYMLSLLGFHVEGWWNRTLVRLPTSTGYLPLTRRELRKLQWKRSKNGVLKSPGGQGWPGRHAALPLMLAMPLINRAGGSRKQRAAAIELLESLDDPLDMFRLAAKQWSGRLSAMPRHVQLALEMAANEQAERDAIEGDLESLAAAWREAEEVSAIADSLLIPDWIDHLLGKWKSDSPEPSNVTNETEGT